LTGTVKYAGALEGQHVSAGQTIIEFDSPQPGFLADESHAAVLEQQAQSRDAKLKLTRNRVLLSEGAISRQQLEESSRNSIQADELLRQRQMQLKSREDDLNKLTVRAPFAGILTLQNVKKGDHVTINTVVAAVTDTSRYMVTVEVDELDVPRLKTGQAAMIALDAMPEKRFPAKVKRIVPSTDRVTKTSKVYLSFEKPVSAIQGGMTATANIIYNTKQGALLVRKSSVFEDGGKRYVWKIDKGRLKKQQVKTGESDITFVEVLGGLVVGDLVVLTPEEKFREGMETRLVRNENGKPSKS
jgi:RND family efflux transporter MFP subunit